MPRIVRKLMLGVALLVTLPVAGAQLSANNASMFVVHGGGSTHYKNSNWPSLTSISAATVRWEAPKIAI